MAAAIAAPFVRIEAEVDPKLRWVSGRIHVSSPRTSTLVDPLAGLPLPEDDLTLFRTFPGAIEQGHVRFGRIDHDSWWFYTVLPRRYGDVGATAHGLFANGAWYPQPLFAGELPVVQWDVEVTFPERVTGVLGDRTGSGTLRWAGWSERVSLAAVPRARSTPIAEDGLEIVLVTRGAPRQALVRELRNELDAIRPSGERWEGVVVEAPLRRRLARPGVGVAYVSDRAYAVTPGLRRFHRVAVTRAIAQGLLFDSDPIEREIAAAALSRRHARALAGLDAREVLGLGSWMPGIHALLYDRRMAFVGDVLEEAFPSDPLGDDLVERYAPHVPGTTVVAQLADEHGEGAVDELGVALLGGASLEEAVVDLGMEDRRAAAWRQPYPTQDYVLEVGDGAVHVERRAPRAAPPEPVMLAIDGERELWTAAPGAVWTRELPDLDRFAIDPDGHVRQSSRAGDSWPTRWLPTFAGWVDLINVQERYAEGALYASLRRSGDTRDVYSGFLYTDRQSLVGATVGWSHKMGPLVDGLDRVHRVSLSGGPAVLDPRFAEVGADGRVALGGAVRYSFDNRVDWVFPLDGERFSIGVDGGFVPGTSRTWLALRSGAGALWSPHPRHAFAANAQVGVARGEVTHRLLTLGGEGALRSIPAEQIVGTERAIARAEWRVAPIRNASVPLLGVLWGRELQLSGGAEAGTVWVRGEPMSAAGATVGISLVGDWLGFDAAMMGATAGWPVWTDGFVVPDKDLPEWSIRWSQAF